METRNDRHPHKPRMQCGDINHSSISCYFYRPVKPLVIVKEQDDPRPQFAGIVSARSEPVGIAECRLVASVNSDELRLTASRSGEGTVLYWDISDEVNKSRITIWLPFGFRVFIGFRAWIYRKSGKRRIRKLMYKILYRVQHLFGCVEDFYAKEEDSDIPSVSRTSKES